MQVFPEGVPLPQRYPGSSDNYCGLVVTWTHGRMVMQAALNRLDEGSIPSASTSTDPASNVVATPLSAGERSSMSIS